MVKILKVIKKRHNTSFIVAQIESKKAVDNLNDIVSVQGLDAIFIGPYDLSASINQTGNFEHKEFQSLLKKINLICKKIICQLVFMLLILQYQN